MGDWLFPPQVQSQALSCNGATCKSWEGISSEHEAAQGRGGLVWGGTCHASGQVLMR